jgi:hypothetical protein
MITFENLVKDQFVYGGKKYALSGHDGRESTDDLFDDFSQGWLFGTMGKYCKRYLNLHRERDLLKIACYSFLVWLKRGFHIDYRRVAPIDTNLEVKEKYFDEYIRRYSIWEFNYNKKANKIKKIIEYNEVSYIFIVYEELKNITKLDWKDIQENSLFSIFYCMRTVWNERFSTLDNHDTDTNNEDK